jgi:hypothetical protein
METPGINQAIHQESTEGGAYAYFLGMEDDWEEETMEIQLTGINRVIAQKLTESGAYFLGMEDDCPEEPDAPAVYVRNWRIAIHSSGAALELRCEGHIFDYILSEEEDNVTEQKRLATLISELIAEEERD